MGHLTHYIVVRRDLPLGVLLAQVTHAAGESFYKLADVAQNGPAATSGAEQRVPNPQVGGSTPPVGSFNPAETFAVVLGSRNEHRLLKLERALLAAGVPFVPVREPDAPYNGALMALGLVPGDGAALKPLLNDFHMLRELDQEPDALELGAAARALGKGGY